MGLVLGPTIGPLLGGYLVDYFSWQWCFFVNIPVGLLASWAAFTFIREPKVVNKVKKIDWAGIGLLARGASVRSSSFLNGGQSKDWFATPYITLFTLIAVVSLAAFVWWELHTEHPAVDLSVLARRQKPGHCRSAHIRCGLRSLWNAVYFPVFVQRLLGFTAVLTGLVLFPSAILTGAISMPLGIALQKGASAKLLMAFGMAAFMLFSWELGQQTMQSGATDFFWVLLLRGLALGFIFIPVTMLAVTGLHGRDIGQATGLNNMVRQLGGSFGIAITNTYIAQRVAAHRVDLISSLSPFDNQAVSRLDTIGQTMQTAGGLAPADAANAATRALDGIVMVQSHHLAYMDAFMLIAVLFLCCLPLLFFIKEEKGAPKK